MALPLRLLALTISPSRTRRTICISTTSSREASTPNAVRAAFSRGT